jgi:uncharacterized protein YccT (UPF0319 family)
VFNLYYLLFIVLIGRFYMEVRFVVAKGLLILSMLFLMACSTGKIVKTYEGDALSAEQLTVLIAPENIVVLSVNGNRVKRYLLSDLNVSYGLKPGENLVVFQYESVWAKTIREDKDAPRSVKITSEPKEVLIDAKAGEKLHFRFKDSENVREARALSEVFEAELIDSKLNVIAQSTNVGSHENHKAEEKNIAQTQTSDLATVDALKVLWGAASAEEKKTFLSWAFQK